MARNVEINDLLVFLHSYFKNNNRVPDEGIVYQALCNYGYTLEELNVGLAGAFSPWIERFRNVPNINVFQDARQIDFLQFHNGRERDSKHIKLYVSLAPNAIYEGVNTIFDFIAKNNMKTCSKVASTVRSDEIVLRMENMDEAEKVINFINSNKFLVDNARYTNPFLNREGIVGIAYDDLLSYNSTVAHFVAEYLRNTNQPSYNEFLYFINNKYTNLFNNQSELAEFTNSEYFNKNLNRVKNGFSFLKHPEYYITDNFRIVLDAIKNNVNMYSYKNLYGLIDQSKAMFDQLTPKDPTLLLNDYIKYAFEKYNHDYNEVIIHLESFQGDNEHAPNINAITRDNNFRYLFSENINPYMLKSLTYGNLDNYVWTIVNYEYDFANFIEGLRTTYLAHGEGQLYACIDSLLDGNFQVMSNGDFGYRNYFKQKYSPEVLGLISKLYFSNIINSNELKDDYKNVIVDTLKSEYRFENIGKSR